MESIRELREKLQKEKLEGRERPWGYRRFQRGPSIFITRILLATIITPNQITLLSLASGLAGSLALLLSLAWQWKLAGMALLYLHLLLDRVDGEVARYKQIYSLEGIYLDEINHALIPPLFFFSLAWGIAETSLIAPSFILAGGATAAFASMLLRITLNLPYQIFMKKYLKYHTLFPLPPSAVTTRDIRAQHALLYPIAKVAHQFQDFFVTLVIFALAMISERLVTSYGFLYPFTAYLLVGYAVYLSFVVMENIGKGARTIEARMRELREAEYG